MSDQQTTSEKRITKTTEAVMGEAKRIEENCLYTSKGHFCAAQFWSGLHLSIGVPTAIAAAAAGALAFAAFPAHNVVAGLLSIIVAVASGVTAFLKPNDRASLHLVAGNNYDALLTRARIFWTIECWQEKSEEALTQKLQKLSEERTMLNAKSPQVSRLAFYRAKRGIVNGEASYEVDKKKPSPGSA